DRIMAMDLSHGGHLSHGSPVSFSGKLYDIVPYGVAEETEELDYDALEEMAKKEKPRMIVTGASAYSRTIDFKRFREIADSVDAYLLADVAHIAGLIAAGEHPSPVPYADFVTTTTHKTLRGPRGGMVMCCEEYAKGVDKTVFPGIQGGPLMHIIAAKAVAFKEALSVKFKQDQKQTVKNAKALCANLIERDFDIVAGGTDNHLMLINLNKYDLTGKETETYMSNGGIVINKNTIPFETRGPFITSGLRAGTPAVTTRGMKEAQMEDVANFLETVIQNPKDQTVLDQVNADVQQLCNDFPIYKHL
ncbi:serine hydroxymethyltransferase, partial [Methanohalophilus profundi]|uniref:serine hydroxymethyltransferase n=1 Tax=Methanohalophilus profundi TaxID=2138083 RepID=UPI0013EB528C